MDSGEGNINRTSGVLFLCKSKTHLNPQLPLKMLDKRILCVPTPFPNCYILQLETGQ